MNDVLGVGARGGVTLPDDAVTQGFAVLARRRSGKSNLAGVMEETFCDRGDPWVCLDPVSAHWGIRYQDDAGKPGKASGYEILIVGGKQADVPLDPKAGASLAQVLVDTGISCIVDLGEASMNASQLFVADFANELLRLNETPRHVLLEEAHEFVPQQLVWDNQKLVRGAISRMIKLGGGRGIGFTLISQRPAAVAKDVLEQIDNLFVLRMNGPNDLKAARDWFEHNVGDKAELAKILDSLPGFKPGEAWLCSPDWLHQMERITVRERRTYHAGRTPKRGEKPVAPTRVELGKVIEQFREAADKRHIAVQLEKDLKAENADLRRQIVAAAKTSPAPTVKPCDHEHQIAELKQNVVFLEGWLRSESQGREDARVLFAQAVDVLQKVDERGPGTGYGQHRQLAQNVKLTHPVKQSQPQPERKLATKPAPRTPTTTDDDVRISGPQQKILDTLGVLEAMGVDRPDKSVVAVFSGASPTSSSYTNNLGHLRNQLAFIDYPAPGVVCLTDAGRDRVAPPERVTLQELHDLWCLQVSGPQAAILRAVIERYPSDIAKDLLAAETGASATSSSYTNNLGRLRTLGAIDYPSPGRVVATELLFPPGLE